MKKPLIFFIGVAFVMGLVLVLHAQQATSSSQTISTMSDLEVMVLAVEQTPPLPASEVPDLGNFYSTQHLPGTINSWPPLPGNIWNLPAWPLGNGFFLLDDVDFDYDALAAAAAPMSMSMMMSSLAYGDSIYLTNMMAVPDNSGTMTASFSIAGGTNRFVPYDILTSTNLDTPFADWTWLGTGYSSNSYTFYGQSADNAFYFLAKPSKTMTVGWGDDSSNQCDVPYGLTNAVQVAGGLGYSLALLNDGTVVGWGDDSTVGLVPSNLVGNVAMIAAGWNFNVALLTNGTVTAWGQNVFGELDVPTDLTNAIVISAQALNTLALRSDETVVAWGDNSFGQTNVPAGLTNVTAIAAGGEHSLAVSNGIVIAWGYDGFGQCNIPSGLSNVVDVAASGYHSLALLDNGTVVAWGDNAYGECNVPSGLSNVVAIGTGGDSFLHKFGNALPYSLALQSDGTLVTWGAGQVSNPLGGLNQVLSLGTGPYDALAIRTGPPTPVITLEPIDQYQVAGGFVTFTAKGAGLYGVTYQWQTNGVNLAGATDATLTLTNVQPGMEGPCDVVVTDNGGMGSITSSNANLYVVTPPVITYQSEPTNILCIYGNHIAFNATATAPYQANGFPLSYKWQFDGTNMSGQTSNAFDGFATNDPGTYTLVVANAAGSASASWQVANTNAINVTNDLLLIYNSNSQDSSNLCAYYLAHRPMVSGANVLAVDCTNGEFFFNTNDWDTQLVNPVLNWLTNNPTKLPQYVILFYDIPMRLWLPGISSGCGEPLPEYGYTGSVSYHLQNSKPGWQPFVNNINQGTVADCEAYVDKIAAFATNFPGQLIISASAGNYGNTNFVLDNARHGPGYGYPNGDADFSGNGYVVSDATNSLLASGVSPSAIIYNDGLDTITTVITNGVTNNVYYYAPQIASATNVAGYICWGEHGALGENYALDGKVKWAGNSGWWIIETIESFNGMRNPCAQVNFIEWYSSNAFGGTNYSNTPIGAVSHTEEPFLPGVENSATYFGLWASGKDFAICAWNSRQTPYFQAVGDPFVTK